MRHTGMFRVGVLLWAVSGAVGCSVEQTREAEAPEVSVDAGRLPQYDVNWADVDVGTTQRTVTVPVVRVEQETREVTVPHIDINLPGGGAREERTISVEVEVPHAGYVVSIDEVRAANDDLWVIARLAEESRAPAAQAVTRVSDQVVVNAPADLDIREVVLGERPAGTYNMQYRFVDSTATLDQLIPEGARVIYRRQES